MGESKGGHEEKERPARLIVTVQPVLNELDILEVKFEELKGVVDGHIVIESPTTFTGYDKPLYFLDSIERFRKFPILHQIVELPEKADSPWQREQATHEAMKRMVEKLNPDIVIWLDADEVPRAEAIQNFTEMKVLTARLVMEQINFYFNRRCTWMKWPFAKISREGTKQAARCDRDFPLLPGAGWHFQNFGTKQDILLKLNSFSHAHDDTTAHFRKDIMAGERPGLDPCEPYDALPEFVLNSRARFSHHFL